MIAGKFDRKENVQNALKITGFSVCNFKSDGQDECDQCLETINVGSKIYFESTCYENDEGNYYCEQCLLATPERMEKDANSYADYIQENY